MKNIFKPHASKQNKLRIKNDKIWNEYLRTSNFEFVKSTTKPIPSKNPPNIEICMDFKVNDNDYHLVLTSA